MEILDEGCVLLGFHVNGKDLLVSFQVFLENDGRSGLYVLNLGTGKNDIDYDFFEIYVTFERWLSDELNDIVDLTV